MDDPSDPYPSASTDRDDSWPPTSALDQDEMFEALTHERRRYLLYTLFDDDAISLQELAKKLTSWEDGVPKVDIDEEKFERVYASLYHAHVPKLADLDIIDFDRANETITEGANAEPVLQALEMTGASRSNNLENHARRKDFD